MGALEAGPAIAVNPNPLDFGQVSEGQAKTLLVTLSNTGGVPLNITSFVGAIMMVGIVAENAYFLVREHRIGLAAGMTPADAAEAAARRRARPVLMTTAAGVAALAPLAIGLGSGSALLRPLAIAVVGGFTLSALLLLLVLPSLLVMCGTIVAEHTTADGFA